MCAAREPYLCLVFPSALPLYPNTAEAHVFAVPPQETTTEEAQKWSYYFSPKGLFQHGNKTC